MEQFVELLVLKNARLTGISWIEEVGLRVRVCVAVFSLAISKSRWDSLRKSFRVLGADGCAEVRSRMLWRRTWPVKLFRSLVYYVFS